MTRNELKRLTDIQRIEGVSEQGVTGSERVWRLR